MATDKNAWEHIHSRSSFVPGMSYRHENSTAETRSVNLIVSDADAIYARAKAAGAEILFDIEDKPYGGRGFTCRDLEGRIWNVGAYDPWQPK